MRSLASQEQIKIFLISRNRQHTSKKNCCKPNNTPLNTKSILSMEPRIYHHLPKSILESPSTDEFKNISKIFLLYKIMLL